MTYSDLLLEEQIILAVEFIGRGQDIPMEIRTNLGPSLCREIENPETIHDKATEGERPDHHGSGH